jgi:glutaminyl-peptide cyclotransferase
MKLKKIILLFVLCTTLIFNSCSKEVKQEVSKPLYELQKNNNIPKFDGNNAYEQVDAQVKFGPRDPGSKGHQQTLKYIENILKKYTNNVEFQNFTYPGYDSTTLQLTNIIAKFNPEKKNRIMFFAHWDTRPRAEHATKPALKDKPILGANDGASGCGVLLELARILKDNKIDYGIDLVFLDGEDYGKEHDLNNFCLGAKYFAAHYPTDKLPAFGVLLDLVGDKQAVFEREGSSDKFAPGVVSLIWGVAQQLNTTVFSQEGGSEIYDDHIPLNQAGLITADIIDADLVGADTPVKRRNYWHSENDNMENISKDTLQQLGDVLTYLIYSLKFNN